MGERRNPFPAEATLRQVLGSSVAVDYLRAPYAGYPEHTHTDIHVAIPVSLAPMAAAWRGTTGRLRRQALGGSDICVVPATRPHNIVWEGTAAFVFLYFTPTQLAFVAHDLIAGEPGEIIERYGANDPLVRCLGAAMEEEFVACGTPSPLYIESAMQVLAVHLLRRYTAHPGCVREPHAKLSPTTWQQLREYIAAHLAADLSLSAMAAVCYLSPYHFARAFKHTAGQTPHAYVMAARIAYTQQLLCETDHPVGVIAAHTGFGSQSHLAAQFRRHTGMTPQQYRVQTTGNVARSE